MERSYDLISMEDEGEHEHNEQYKIIK